MSRLRYRPGDRLAGRLTYVAEASPAPRRKRQVQVQCDCSATFVAQLGNVRAGNTTQCKTCSIASRSAKLRRDTTHTHQIFMRYRNQAESRGIQFDLTEPELAAIIAAPCHWCGVAASANLTVNGRPFPYNGVDRVNNDDHYRRENCVPCCIWCNTSKAAKPVSEWLAWVARIHHLHNQEITDVPPVGTCEVQRAAPWGKARRLPRSA